MFLPHVKAEAVASPELPFPYPTLYRFGSAAYDDTDVISFLPPASRTVRRRSSKACDQCRKSKCKCERLAPSEPCKNCNLLGTSCTFLGPSRKRGPPKGYIDAIEARLHQTEALVGIMLASRDPRAQSLLRDIARDPVAHEIIARVDASPYGVKGRSQDFVASTTKKYDSSSHHPSNEWQDAVVDMLNAGRTDHPLYHQLPSPATTSAHLDHDLPQALGELSLNEDDQVRHHGHASGLYLLGDQERLDNRYKGGIWRFPGARVWPPLPPTPQSISHSLPPIDEQERLLGLYFTHVHPFFPVIHKTAFWDAWNDRIDSHLSPLLLFAMFSIAARYDAPTRDLNFRAFPSPSAPESTPNSAPPLPTDGLTMWAAGENYFNSAKFLLQSTFASPRPTTCQALLLMGYREIGIGAMTLAWTLIGMAVRMAQDLGMHRNADGWRRPAQDQDPSSIPIFSASELEERRRIWFGCVVMDQYVSVYIGRPLMIYENDYDTDLPQLIQSEETEDLNFGGQLASSVSGRFVSCFNKFAQLSGILSSIMRVIYAVRSFPTTSSGTRSSREAEKQVTTLESILNEWYLDLPQHLSYDIGASSVNPPPPHVLTLHMQYWCAVLLLHRPFIRRALDTARSGSDRPSNPDDLALISSKKSYEMCVTAAGHITSITTSYRNVYPLNTAPVFLCYYVFTASIMHVISLSAHPGDPLARTRLGQCLEALTAMRFVWPSAERALDLLRGAKTNSITAPVDTNRREGKKRSLSFEDAALEPDCNGFGEYIRSNMGTSQFQRPSLQRELTRSTQSPLPLPPSYPTAAQTYAIQPPSYLWVDSSSCGGSGSLDVSPVVGPNQLCCDDERGQFSGTLSTSVLPQVYSTGFGSPSGGGGFGCDRLSSSSSSSSSSSQGAQHQRLNHQAWSPPQTQCYSKTGSQLQPMQVQPQFWNDFSTLSQLGSTAAADGCGGYNNYHHHQQHLRHQQPSNMSGMYYDQGNEPVETCERYVFG